MYFFIILSACSSSSDKPVADNNSENQSLQVAPPLHDDLKFLEGALKEPLTDTDQSVELRWSIPTGCTLKYQYKIETTPIAKTNGKKSVDYSLKENGSFRLLKTPKSFYEIQYSTVHKVRSTDNSSKKSSVAPDTIERTLLRCNKGCSGFQEFGEPPSKMWSQSSNFPGMGLFFPPYPRKSQVNQTANWLFVTQLHRGRELSETPLPNMMEFENKGMVHLNNWFDSNGTSVGWLKADWEHGSKTKFFEIKKPVGSTFYRINGMSFGKYNGDYLVTDKGRLLWAKVEGSMSIDLGMDLNKGRSGSIQKLSAYLPDSFRYENKVTGELRLISSCKPNEPVLNPFPVSI